MGPPKVATHGTVPRRVDLHQNSRGGPCKKSGVDDDDDEKAAGLAALAEAQEEAAVAEAALAEQDEEYGGALHV